jgi:hypothetical protein
LQAVYPDYVPSEGKPKRHGYWKDKENQKAFFDQLAIKLNIKRPEDWHKVTGRLILNEGGSFLSKYYHYSPLRGNILHVL